MPIVSVIIPTYNHRDFVLQAVESAMAQTCHDYEIIVINDGSPDDTSEVLRPLADAGKIRYIEQKNAGQSATRNRGIAEAKGEFIALLDDDDLWPADKLEWQVGALRENPDAALVYGRLQSVDGSGEPFTAPTGHFRPAHWLDGGPSGNVYEAFIEKNYIISPGQCLIRRAKLAELGPEAFDLNITGGSDDWDLYLRLAKQFRFVFVDRLALNYRVHSSNASNQMWKLWISVLSVQKKMSLTETDVRIKQKWHTALDSFTQYAILTSIDAIKDDRYKQDGFTRAGAFRLLRYLRRETLRYLYIRMRVQTGALRRRILRL